MKSVITIAAYALMMMRILAQADDELLKTMRGMDDAEKRSNEEQRKKVVSLMSLEVMFPDLSVRALAKAAGEGNITNVHRLLKEGVKINSKGTEGATPLFWALHNYTGFSNLLASGADPNAVFGNGVGGSVLGMSVGFKDTRFLQALLEHGGNPNLTDNVFGQTPLFKALSSGTKAVDLLLKAGANINAKDKRGNTPVMFAANTARFEAVYLLLQRGADCRVTNQIGETLASRVGSTLFTRGPLEESARADVVEWLQKAGVEVSVKSGGGQTKVKKQP